jgi:hypothetical protein
MGCANRCHFPIFIEPAMSGGTTGCSNGVDVRGGVGVVVMAKGQAFASRSSSRPRKRPAPDRPLLICYPGRALNSRVSPSGLPGARFLRMWWMRPGQRFA